MAITLWAVQGSAVAGEDCGYPAGGRHAFIGFVDDPDRDLAIERLGRILVESGWRDIAFKRSGIIASNIGIIENEILRAAASTALDEGCGFVVYEDAIEREDSGSRQ